MLTSARISPLAPSVRVVPNYIFAGYIYNTVGTHSLS